MEPPPRRLRGSDHGRFAARWRSAGAAVNLLRPAHSYGQTVPTYGQQEYDASTYGQSAPAYANPYAQPMAPAYGQVPPTYNQYAAPTGAVPLNKPYYGCPFSRSLPPLLAEIHGVQGTRLPQ